MKRPPHSRVKTFTLAVLCAWSLGGCAAPEPAEPAGPFPTGIRIITETDATSDCIGDISTPLCALDTFTVAVSRADQDLYEMVFSPHHYNPSDAAEFPGRLPRRYRIKRFCYSTSEYNFYNYFEPSGSGVFKLHLYMAVESFTLGDTYHTFLVNEAVGWQVIESTILGGDPVECDTAPPPEWRPVVFE